MLNENLYDPAESTAAFFFFFFFLFLFFSFFFPFFFFFFHKNLIRPKYVITQIFNTATKDYSVPIMTLKN